MARRRSRWSRYFGSLLVLLVFTSAVEYYEKGQLSWPRELVLTAHDYTTAFALWLQGLAGPEATASDAHISTAEITANDVSASGLSGRVVKVTDGDTFTLRFDGLNEEIIRLHGIDAPERDQPHGRAATAALTDKLENEQVTVRVEDTDNYGRLVGVVFLHEENINLAMVSEGHAWWYEYYAKSDSALQNAQEQARAARTGLWTDSKPVAPWDWRRAH